MYTMTSYSVIDKATGLPITGKANMKKQFNSIGEIRRFEASIVNQFRQPVIMLKSFESLLPVRTV